MQIKLFVNHAALLCFSTNQYRAVTANYVSTYSISEFICNHKTKNTAPFSVNVKAMIGDPIVLHSLMHRMVQSSFERTLCRRKGSFPIHALDSSL